MTAPSFARHVVNLRGWPGLERWEPPFSPPALSPRLGEQVGLVMVAAGAPLPNGTVGPEAFGLGAYLRIIGTSVLEGGIIVPDHLAHSDPSSLEAIAQWAGSTLLSTTSGPRPWGVTMLAQFYEPWKGTFAATTYGGVGWCIGADLGRVLALAAEHCAPRRGRETGTWELWMPGWGVKGPKGWHRTSPHRPALRLTPRRVGWQVEFGPVGTDHDGRPAGKRVDGRLWRGAFLDVISLAYALDADRGASFAEHCAAFEVEPAELPATVSVDDGGAARLAEAVAGVHRLALALDEAAARYFTTPKHRTFGRGRLDLARLASPAGVAAGIPARFGLRAPIETFGLSPGEHDRWAETFHGGWCQVDRRLLGVPFPVVDADVTSCHPLVAHRLGWWDVLCAERIERHTVTAALRRACAQAVENPECALDTDVWSRFGITLVEVKPRGEPFPVDVEDERRPDGRMEVVPVTSLSRPLWFAWPDVVAAAVGSGRVPHILRAVHYVPVGRQEVRGRLPFLPGVVLRAEEDPVLRLAARRRRAKARDDRTEAAELRMVLNTLVFGNFCRFDEVRRRVGRHSVVDERPGPWNCLPIASSVTAGSRLLLTVLDRLVSDRGGCVAYRDTDSGFIPASPEGGSLQLPGETTVGLLSWAEVDEVLGAFDRLAPAPGWPVWGDKRGSGDHPRRVVLFGAKRHVAVEQTPGGQVIEGTEAQLGSTYADPPSLTGRSDGGLRAWSHAAVTRELTYAERRQTEPVRPLRPDAPWDDERGPQFPTLRRLMVRTPEVARRLPEAIGARPGTLYVVGQVDPLRQGLDPTPVALDPGGDLSSWQDLGWVDKSSGAAVRVVTDLSLNGAVSLETLDGRSVRWSLPSADFPVDEVIVDPLLVRRVGRVSGVIDADLDGLDELATRRPVHSEAAEAEAVSAYAQAMGKRTFARATGLPLTVAWRAAHGLPISVANVTRALHAMRTSGAAAGWSSN